MEKREILSNQKYFVKSTLLVKPLLSRNFCQMWKLIAEILSHRSIIILFRKIFVKAMVLLKEITKKLIWRNFCEKSIMRANIGENSSFFHNNIVGNLLLHCLGKKSWKQSIYWRSWFHEIFWPRDRFDRGHSINSVNPLKTFLNCAHNVYNTTQYQLCT